MVSVFPESDVGTNNPVACHGEPGQLTCSAHHAYWARFLNKPSLLVQPYMEIFAPQALTERELLAQYVCKTCLVWESDECCIALIGPVGGQWLGYRRAAMSHMHAGLFLLFLARVWSAGIDR